MSQYRIWRYKLHGEDEQMFVMPKGARLLSVAPARNGGHLFDLWAQVDTTADEAPRLILVVGTGNPMPDNVGAYVGTAPSHGGQFVWHVFEATR